MEYADFWWNGKLASAMGLVVTEQVSYQRPAERVEEIVIPGRPGVVTLAGSASWENVMYAPICMMKPGTDREAVTAWLRGAGEVSFGSMQEWVYTARLVNQIPYETVWQAQGGYTQVSPVFSCHPLRRRVEGDQEVACVSGQALKNPGTVAARPRIVLKGKGDVTLTVAGQQIQLTGLTDGIILDCEAMECSDLTGMLGLNGCMAGDFPALPPGSSYISWKAGDSSSVTEVRITPRWRWL